jgi:poly(3-hydroxybutyrate) depolymerase
LLRSLVSSPRFTSALVPRKHTILAAHTHTLAEQYGFIVVYPSSPHSGTCWDVSSKQTLTHEGGGDSNTIANMVKWVLSEYKADASKVFVTGSSSGAMMTVHFPSPTIT